jgi:hypothetical protein
MRIAARRIVAPWMEWAIYSLAMQRTADVELSIRTAERAVGRLWDE